MTRVAWNNGQFYGKKTKRYFVLLDKMILKLFTKLNDETLKAADITIILEQILKLTGRQNTLAHTITKLVETLDTNQRLLDIEKLINSIPPQAIAQAREADAPTIRA